MLPCAPLFTPAPCLSRPSPRPSSPRPSPPLLQHACSFDYKTHDRSILAKNNQKVVAEKVEKL